MTVKSSIKEIALIFSLLIFLSSCEKDPVTTPAPPSSKLALLTANVWIYDSVYTNWGSAGQAIVFARNSPSNSQDWSKDRVKFYIDGTFNEILTTGALRQGPDMWTMNNDSTTLSTTGGGFSNSVDMISLTSTKLVWIDNANKMRGVQIPKY